jgi:hypothetical protein
MRWVVVLQIAIGLVALFTFGYLSVDRMVTPTLEAAATRAAEADAQIVALEVATALGRTREAHRRAVQSVVEGGLLRTGGDRPFGALLDAAVAQAGGSGQAAILDAGGAVLGATEGGAALARSGGLASATKGLSVLRLETIEGRPHLVALAPFASDGTRVLAIAMPLDEARLRSWTRLLPSYSAVALLDGTRTLVTTAPEGLRAELAGARPGGTLVGDGHRYSAAVRTQVDDTGAELKILGLARHDLLALRSVTDMVRLMILVLGGVSVLLAVLVLGVAGKPQAAEAAAAPVRAPAPAPPPAAEVVALRVQERPAEPMRAEPPPGVGPAGVDAAAAQSVLGQKTWPSMQAPGTPAAAADIVAAAQSAQPRPGPAEPPPPSSGGMGIPMPAPAHTLSGFGPASFGPSTFRPVVQSVDPQPVDITSRQPQPSVRPAAPSFNPAPVSRGAAAEDPREPQTRPFAAPMSGAEARGPSAQPPPPTTLGVSPFDVIASAAISSPPPPPQTPMPAYASSLPTDLMAPKGGLPPEVLAAQRAEALRSGAFASPATPAFGATPYDHELLAPKQSEALLAAQEAALRASAGSMAGMAGARPAPGEAQHRVHPTGPTTLPNQPSRMTPLGPNTVPGLPRVPPSTSSSLPSLQGLSGGPSSPGPRSSGVPMDPWKNPSIPSMPAVSPGTGRPMPAQPSTGQAWPSTAPQPAESRWSAAEPSRSNADAMRTDPLGGTRSPTKEPPRTSSLGPIGDARPFDDEHYRMVYNEFVAAKSQLGEPVDGITFEGFRTKLRTSEQQLLERHGCRAVRFQVLVKDRVVSLRPQLVR